MPPAPSPNSDSPLPPRSWSLLPLMVMLLLATAAMTFAILAWDYRQRARYAEARVPVPQSALLRERLEKATQVTAHERKFLDALADRYGFRRLKVWNLHDVLMLTTRMNQHLNDRLLPSYDPARTPWLRPMPTTQLNPVLTGGSVRPFELAEGKVDLPENAVLYQYRLTNTTNAPVPMPILYQDLRWDTAEALVASSGLCQVQDELERAKGIWRLVAEHRAHGQPVTEGPEEHDLVKFLSCYGYGFCDDSAQAVAGLASACGLKVRIRGLNGHVVPELFAAGKWRMFDPDFAVYFHAEGDPKAVFGVDDLKERSAFNHAVALGAAGPWTGEYAAPFLSQADNHDWPVESQQAHRIAGVLQPGESVSFGNYNWGRYFVGAFPHKPPRYYNGLFECLLPPSRLQAGPGVTLRSTGDSFVAETEPGVPGYFFVDLQFPFPIVGGRITGVAPEVMVEMVDSNGRKAALRGGREPLLDAGVAQLSATPSYNFTLRFQVPPRRSVRFDRPLRVYADFQHSELVLLNLKPGPNQFKVHGPVTGLKAELRTK